MSVSFGDSDTLCQFKVYSILVSFTEVKLEQHGGFEDIVQLWCMGIFYI